jgi:hypothetical protein
VQTDKDFIKLQLKLSNVQWTQETNTIIQKKMSSLISSGSETHFHISSRFEAALAYEKQTKSGVGNEVQIIHL